MDVQSPELPGRLSLRLDVYSPPQVLQIDGRLCHLVLAFLVVGDFTNSRAPSLHGRYPASTLLRTHPSSLTALWGFPCWARFPCVRAAASTPVQRLGVVFAHLTQPYQPSPKLQSGRPAHRPFRDPMWRWSRPAIWQHEVAYHPLWRRPCKT